MYLLFVSTSCICCALKESQFILSSGPVLFLNVRLTDNYSPLSLVTGAQDLPTSVISQPLLASVFPIVSLECCSFEDLSIPYSQRTFVSAGTVSLQQVHNCIFHNISSPSCIGEWECHFCLSLQFKLFYHYSYNHWMHIRYLLYHF